MGNPSPKYTAEFQNHGVLRGLQDRPRRRGVGVVGSLVLEHVFERASAVEVSQAPAGHLALGIVCKRVDPVPVSCLRRVVRHRHARHVQDAAELVLVARKALSHGYAASGVCNPGVCALSTSSRSGRLMYVGCIVLAVFSGSSFAARRDSPSSCSITLESTPVPYHAPCPEGRSSARKGCRCAAGFR